MRKKIIIAYTTDRLRTTKIVKDFVNGINSADTEYQAKIRSIKDFLSMGHLPGIDAVACLGILRGTGLALQSAARNNIDRFYLDHSYFDSGYDGQGWMRICKNSHTMNYVNQSNGQRWDNYFSEKYKLEPWKNRSQRGDNILILPPTNAVQWYFNAYTWLNDLLLELEKFVPSNLIVVRKKPNEPIVDKLGNLIRLEPNVSNNSLIDDLNSANVVITYNSMSALEASLKGIPIITNKHNCCYPISFTLNNLMEDMNNPLFDIEPNRLDLCKWLSNCQFSREEISNGTAWKLLLETQ